jgi:hypothetical protein
LKNKYDIVNKKEDPIKKIAFISVMTLFLIAASVSAQTKSLTIPGTAFAPSNETITFTSTSDYTGAKESSPAGFFYDAGVGDIDDVGYGHHSDSTGYVRIKNSGCQYVLRTNFGTSSRGSEYRIDAVKLSYNEWG